MNALIPMNGLGCPECGGKCSMNGLGAVADYDKITVGGATYTANQLIGKTVVAKKETKLYSNPKGAGTVLGTVKTGQPFGIVYSYLRPEQTDGRTWLMFDNGKTSFFVPNEAVASTGLKEQGTKTVTQEVKEEEAKKEREEDPLSYYIKKFGVPAILIIGAIVILNTAAREGVKSVLNKKSSSKSTT
jgi:hypothetical protein